MTVIDNVILADDGKAVRKIGTEGQSTIVRVALVDKSKVAEWEDCDYGADDGEATEADKDAALTTLGVDMTEANQ